MQLADYLKKHKKSHDAFGREIGVAGATVSRYANKQRHPEPEIMQKIIDVTNAQVTANDFFEVPESLRYHQDPPPPNGKEAH